MSVDEETKTLEEILAENGIETDSEQQHKLVLWNDDVNSFDWVIICLATLLKFPVDKAEKTAKKVHEEGKDIIKSGSKEDLEPFKKLLAERGLSVTIED